MATVTFKCPNCPAQGSADESYIGRRARCKQCGTAFDVTPLGRETTPPPEAAPPADGVPAVWQVGDVIAELYEVQQVFTGGGMGLVYKVHHRSWNMDLAAKSPRPDFLRTDMQRLNFVQEAETWVNLGLHPHIASCYYVRELGGIPRVFAEYVDGGSLYDWIESGKLYEGGPEAALERILDIAIQFAWGLHYAHEQGLVHQDVKPANVMMTAEGVAKVTDFGLAKARSVAGEPTDAPATAGRSILVSSGGMTPAYCSPEQAKRRPLTRKTDIWSWAVSVLHMFTGEITWSGGQIADSALDSYLETGAEDASLPEMPQRVADLLRHCLQQKPEARPADMFNLAANLQEQYALCAGQAYLREPPETLDLQADVLNNQALSLLDLGQPERAAQLWEQALHVHNHHPEATYNRGVMLWRSGQWGDDALLQHLREVVRSHPKNWLPHYFVACVQFEGGDCQGVLESLEAIDDIGKNRPEVTALRAQATSHLSLSRRLVRTFEGHSLYVYAANLTADGRFALSGSYDQTLKLWDVASGLCLRTFEGHSGEVESACISPDGLHALSGSYDGTLKFWEVATGRCLCTYHGHAATVNAVCLSTDKGYALSGSDDKCIYLWEIASGRYLRCLTGHAARVTAVCLSADVRYAVSGSDDQTIKLWDVVAARCVRTFAGQSNTESVCLSADGHYAVSGGWDATVKLWEVATGDCVRTFRGHTTNVSAVCLSADGNYLLSGSLDKKVKLWEVVTGRCLRTFTGHAGSVNSVCFSVDGKLGLSASGDKSLKLWALEWDASPSLAPSRLCRAVPSEQLRSAQRVYEQKLHEARQALAQGDAIQALHRVRVARLQAGYQRGAAALELWHRLSLHLPRKAFCGGWESTSIEAHAKAVTSARLDADGAYVLSGSGDMTVKLWEVASGQCMRTFEGHTNYVWSVCLNADGRYALSGSWDQTLKLWNVATGRCLRTFHGHDEGISSVCLGADGAHALSGSRDMTLKLWGLAGGRCLRTFAGHVSFVESVSLSADGRYALSGSRDTTVKLWEVASGRCLRTFEGHGDNVNSVCFSEDGRYALSGSDDKTVKLWNLAGGSCVRTFQSHTRDVTSVCLSANGDYVLSGSRDRTLKLWDTATGNCLRTFEGHTDDVQAVALAGNGCLAASASSDSTLKLWALDWDLEEKAPTDWDEGAKPYLDTFLTLHTPYSTSGLAKVFQPAEDRVALSLTRRGSPSWNESDFQQLLNTLGCAGYGWLRPEGVRRELERMAAAWQGPAPLL